MNYIGIDIGTSSICGVVSDNSNQVMESITIGNNTSINSREKWEKIQDPQKILKLAEEIINTFCSRYADIRCV